MWSRIVTDLFCKRNILNFILSNLLTVTSILCSEATVVLVISFWRKHNFTDGLPFLRPVIHLSLHFFPFRVIHLKQSFFFETFPAALSVRPYVMVDDDWNRFGGRYMDVNWKGGRSNKPFRKRPPTVHLFGIVNCVCHHQRTTGFLFRWYFETLPLSPDNTTSNYISTYTPYFYWFQSVPSPLNP